jgi:hypothetical protein
MIPRDICTRWNATYNMLDFAYQYKKAINIITDIHNRVIQSCYLLATYHVTYFTTYLIRRTKRRPISDIMNLIGDYSGWPTYCPLLIGQLI